MNNFSDRIFLLLTLKDKELKDYYFQTIGIIIALSIYNLISLFISTPRLVSYWAILIAFILVTITFIILRKNRLPINWKLLEQVDEEIKEAQISKPKADVESTPIVEDVVLPTNEEIQMVEVDEEEPEFDFADNLMALYKTAPPDKLADVAVNGIEQKVRLMNKDNLRIR